MTFSHTSAVTLIVLFFGLAFVLGVLAENTGTPRQGSYTGIIQDVQLDTGVIFKTSQVYLKTGEHSSEHEVFCIHPDYTPETNWRELVGKSVTVEYERGFWVWFYDCKSMMPSLSYVTDIEAGKELHNG